MDIIRAVQKAQLDILLETVRICSKYNIRYILVGGTLIGAIRHNGFIPWDDDIDICMLRSDYERFKLICTSELNEKFELFDWRKDQNSPLPFSKIKIKGTHYSESLASDSNVDDGIFIDIFPLDNMSDKCLERKLQIINIYMLKKILLLRCGYKIDVTNNPLKKIIFFAAHIIARSKTINYWKDKYESIAQRNNKEDTNYIINWGGAYSARREMQPKSIMDNITLHEFEGYSMCVPEDYDGYLKRVYDDYMKLPPEEERIGRHNVLNIDFGQYKEEYLTDEND